MPGKQRREKGEKLSRLQSKIAKQVLSPHFEPAAGEKQFDDEAKRQLVEAVNDAFVAVGEDPVYTQRKLEDWVSNGIYRWRKQASNQLPPSWAHRGGKAKQRAGAATKHAAQVAAAQQSAALSKRKRVPSDEKNVKVGGVFAPSSSSAGAPPVVVVRGIAAQAQAQAPAVPPPHWSEMVTQAQSAPPFSQTAAAAPAAGAATDEWTVDDPDAQQQQQQQQHYAGGMVGGPGAATSAASSEGGHSASLGIRRRTLSERSLRLQAQAAEQAHAEEFGRDHAELRTVQAEIEMVRSESDRSDSVRSLGSLGHLGSLGQLPSLGSLGSGEWTRDMAAALPSQKDTALAADANDFAM